MRPTKFKVTEEHILLLRNSYVEQHTIHHNAEIDSKRPYGDSDIAGSIHKVLLPILPKRELTESPTDFQENRYMALHEQMPTVLQIVLVTGKFEPGTYVMEDPYSLRSWRKVK